MSSTCPSLSPQYYIMATRVTWSQTHAIGPNPPLSLRYNPLSAFGSNRRGAEIVDQFLSFSARWATPLISQNRPPPESPTPATCIVVLPNNYESLKITSLVTLLPSTVAGEAQNFPGMAPQALPQTTMTLTCPTMTSSLQTLTQTKNYQQSRSLQIRCYGSIRLTSF